MKSSAKKIELASVDDLFSTEEGRQDAKLEKIQEIPLSELHPFKNHPFKVKDDEAMMETADSIKQYGVLVPAIARPDPEGGYELVAGHRRRRASELAEKETMPVIIRDLDDDAATIIMVDSNLQRESLLPSERAFAYKMKLEAVKHQGARTDLTSRQVGEKSQTSIQKVADQAGESQRQVQRYIRLTELIPELMDMVDEKKIALNPAYELSFLKKEEQVDLLDAMDSEQATPSLSQAQRLKGNAALVDDFGGNKQLITVTTKAGNYFYILIDRANEDKKTAVHFLNQVDEADLMALMEDENVKEKPAAVCSCTTKCEAGAVNTACPVCATDKSKCTGKAPEPPAETPEPEKEKPAGLNPAAIVLLLALLGGGGVFAYLKLVKNKPKTKGNDSLDDYDYGEEDSEEWETEDEESDEPDADGGSTEEDDEDSVK